MPYDWATGAPPPMAWDDYVPRASQEFADLLKDGNTDEKRVQYFLESHPSLLPPPRSWHGGWPHMVIRQPQMKGFEKRIPDFMLLEMATGWVRAILVEIESPSKRWTTEGGEQHSALTQAIGQLQDWKAWFSDSNHGREFRDYYQLPPAQIRREFEQRYALIYGRRDNALSHETFSARLRHLDSEDTELMSYDRLTPSADLANFVAVQRVTERQTTEPRFELVGMPPTFALGPSTILLCKMVRLNESAVKSMPYVGEERKEFIIKRWRYWGSQQEWKGGDLREYRRKE